MLSRRVQRRLVALNELAEALSMDPWISFLLVLLIGVVAGVIAQRGFSRSWLSGRVGRATGSDVTSALVGIAGAFIGFHLTALLVVPAATLVLLLGAIIGAVVILWGWKAARL